MEIPKSFKIDFNRLEDGTIEAEPEPDYSGADLRSAPDTFSASPEEGDPPVSPPSTTSPTPGEEPPSGEPSLILGKFKSQADLEAAYKALEQRLGQTEAKPSEDSEVPADEPTEALRGPETDFSEFTREFQEKGALSEDSYRTLQEAHGLPREFVDAYIEGQKALAERTLTSVMREAGVKDSQEYQQIVAWAQKSLSAAEVEAFNRVAQSEDVASTTQALKGLVAQYRMANRGKPKLVKGRPAPTPLVKPFSSTGEMQHAMADPRYQYDEAYRKEVEVRLAHSNILDGQVRIKGPNR